MLLFGQRKVGVPVSLAMQVAELCSMVAQIADLRPTDLALMWGEAPLHLDNVLGDYLSAGDARGSIITVVSSVGVRTTPAGGVRTTPASPPAPRFTGDSVPSLPPSSSGGSSGGSDRGVPDVFLINLVYETGVVLAQPVTPDMLLGQVRRSVATLARVEYATVSLVFKGALLGSSIYVYFSHPASVALPFTGHPLFHRDLRVIMDLSRPRGSIIQHPIRMP
jgi:hypothetical protein